VAGELMVLRATAENAETARRIRVGSAMESEGMRVTEKDASFTNRETVTTPESLASADRNS
jgi:hypothetical protein